jgi:hypothetical protein
MVLAEGVASPWRGMAFPLAFASVQVSTNN